MKMDSLFEIAADDRHKLKQDWVYVRAVLKPKAAAPKAAAKPAAAKPAAAKPAAKPAAVAGDGDLSGDASLDDDIKGILSELGDLS
jgi:hypothetical protein